MVYSIEDLAVVISHIDKYMLVTQKCADYLLFKMIFNLIEKKEHLSMEGLLKIVSIKASMNQGLSSQLKEAFPNIVPAARPLILNQKNKRSLLISWIFNSRSMFLYRYI